MTVPSKNLLGILLIALMVIVGCMATSTTTVTTDNSADNAQQDSIANAEREYNLRLNRMYAYDYLKAQDWLKARKYLWTVVDLDIHNEYNVWARLYQTYISLNDGDSAQYVIKEGLNRYPQDTYLNATMGYFLKQQGMYEDALKHYQVANKAEEPNVEYIKAQAEIEENLNLSDEAIASYERLLKISPEDQDAKDRYTSLLKKHRDPVEYIASLKADVENNPDDQYKRMELIHAYDGQSMNQEVIVQCDELLKRDPQSIDTYFTKAKSQENLSNFTAAIATYEALLTVDANNARAMLKIADDKRIIGQFKSARTWVNKARSAGGDAAAADYTLAMIYESIVEKCAGASLKYDDKLINIVAYGLLSKVANSSNYEYKERASNRIKYYDSANFVPSYSDYFMNQSQKMAEEKCYEWISGSWPEVKYIKTFLDKLAKSKQ